MRILVVNAGSSSLKLRVLDGADLVTEHDLPADANGFDTDALAAFLDGVGVDAVGHRVVHGGRQFTEPTLIDAEVVAALHGLTDLAPLHQPKALAGIDAVGAVLPDTPAVACFDTAFHANIPAAAYTYAIPAEWRTRWGVRRYGFHGLSHSWASGRAAEILRRPVVDLRIVVCHLGAGASLCAVGGGKSLDTTMGFTPLEGLVMATRSGSVDPGIVLWLLDAGVGGRDLRAGLEKQSGLLALAGTADMQALLAAAARGEEDAVLAIDVYIHRLAASVAAMTASLGGLDVLVFTGGVGENAAVIRQRTAERLTFLGVKLGLANEGTRSDGDISAPGAAVRTVVVQAREDLEIARGVGSVLAPPLGVAGD